MAPLSTQQRRELDDAHSNRTIELDPSGYFLIRVDAAAGELVVQHFGNGINEQGLATDPDTGEVLSCRGAGPRICLLYTSPSPRDQRGSRMPSSA